MIATTSASRLRGTGLLLVILPASWTGRPQDALPLKQHQESVGNKINPTDVVIAPGSNSPGARQPECAIIPLPASQRNQDGLKAELQKLCGRYKTRVIYKQLPLDFVGDAENANDAAHDA